jgi:histidinol-phosphatase (PHP family)
MSQESLAEYVEEIEATKAKFAGQLEIYRGLEVDYVPGQAGPSHQRLKDARLDYTIGSVHLVDFFPDGRPWEIDGPHRHFLDGLNEIFHRDIQAAVERYYALTREMIENDPPDVLGHLDKIKMQNEEGTLFSDQAVWYQEAVETTLQLIARKSLIVEVNTRGIYKKKTTETYPSPAILRRMKALGIPIMINSDAHHPRELDACFEETARLLLQIGYTHCRVLLQGKWQDLPFSAEGMRLENA